MLLLKGRTQARNAKPVVPCAERLAVQVCRSCREVTRLVERRCRYAQRTERRVGHGQMHSKCEAQAVTLG